MGSRGKECRGWARAEVAYPAKAITVPAIILALSHVATKHMGSRRDEGGSAPSFNSLTEARDETA
jgi:hypothetical protein